MCGLFGLLDYQRKLSSSERLKLLTALSIESEIRGTDASGIACYQRKKLHIQKAPGPAHQMEWDIGDASFIMGHTRAATLGSPKDNYNNHPFPGICWGILCPCPQWGFMGQPLPETETAKDPGSDRQLSGGAAIGAAEGNKPLHHPGYSGNAGRNLRPYGFEP